MEMSNYEKKINTAQIDHAGLEHEELALKIINLINDNDKETAIILVNVLAGRVRHQSKHSELLYRWHGENIGKIKKLKTRNKKLVATLKQATQTKE